MSEIAQRIRAARDVHGWSQEVLAYRSGVSRPSVARIEAGEDVSTATLSKVAHALGLTLYIANTDEASDGK